ncbi:hypothetical protein [Sphaerisporangium siamense]|uniref:DUF1360 domain-containing protein n=1 Tax=Sphaerisporangium siamense TaxID=795645 RepID=A0A7W7DAR1_9ACTN|nr:hypothetical protein [Sphaerisporangium siamense]MBB4702515.1 hypothetical protein [Sphaerisporangium siamense]
MDAFTTAAVLALAIGAVACTISLAKVFAPARAWVAGRRGRAWRWLADLIGCPYCVSHWLAFSATVIYRPRLVSLWLPLDLAVTTMAIVALAMLPVLVIRRGIAPVRIQIDHHRLPATVPTTLLSSRDRAHLNGAGR